MRERQGQHVVERGKGSEVDAVGRFLEAQELDDVAALAVDFPPDLVEAEHVGVAQIVGEIPRIVEDFADIPENEGVGIRQLREPGGGEGGEEFALPDLALQALPDALGVGGVGADGEGLVGKEGQRVVFAYQDVGKLAARVGIEDGRQQALEGFVVAEHPHGSSKNKLSCRSSAARGLGFTRRRRTPSGVIS